MGNATKIGLLIGFSGSLLIGIKKQISSGELNNSTYIGIISNFLAVFSKSTSYLLSEKIFKSDKGNNLKTLSFGMGQAIAGALISIPLAICWDFLYVNSDDYFIYDNDINWISDTLPALLYLGIMSSCVVYYLQFYIVRNAGTLRSVTVDFLTPAIGVIEGGLILCDFCNASFSNIILSIIGTIMGILGVICVYIDKNNIKHNEYNDTPILTSTIDSSLDYLIVGINNNISSIGTTTTTTSNNNNNNDNNNDNKLMDSYSI
jgi:drug/metabolite transporter (DMT)-like permease